MSKNQPDDYRLISKIKNNRILSVLESRGYKTVGAFCAAKGFCASHVGELVNMKRKPLQADGNWRKIVLDMCDALFVSPDMLFTEIQQQNELTRNTAEKTFAEIQLLQIVNKTPESALLENDLPTVLDDVLRTLTPKERIVLEARFGLNGAKESTREQIGRQFDVTVTRITQIEEKAMRKLRQNVGLMAFAGDMQ